MKHEFLDLMKLRRTRYDLTNKSTLPKEEIVKLVQQCVKHAPSPFNSQSTRVLLLCGKRHQQFWDKVWHNLKKVIPTTGQKSIKAKIESFAAAHGTILFFEDKTALAELKKQFPLYAKNMKIWTQQANGMLQFMVWQVLAENNIGASLQHYNELIEKDLGSMYDIPKNWELVAQMPFGSIEKEPAEKTFLPLEGRVRIFK